MTVEVKQVHETSQNPVFGTMLGLYWFSLSYLPSISYQCALLSIAKQIKRWLF